MYFRNEKKKIKREPPEVTILAARFHCLVAFELKFYCVNLTFTYFVIDQNLDSNGIIIFQFF